MILATRSGDRLVRDASVGAVLAAEGLSRGSAGATAVTARGVLGLPAAKEAIRIASEAVAKARFGVFRGEDVERQPVRTTWQARFFRGVPNERESWADVFEQTEASLTARNNAFWIKQYAAGLVNDVYVAHPDNVEARWNKQERRVEYRVRDDSGGGWSEWVDRSVILHFRKGYLEPACIVAPTPLALHRETLRSALAKVRYEADHYDEGLLHSLAVEFPKGVTREQAERFRDLLQADSGLTGRQRIKVVGEGAKVTTIGLSLEDAQYVESMQMSVQELARIFGVPASLVGGAATTTQASAPISPEHEETRWHTYGLSPRLNRIESAINADPSFFGPNARDYGRFAGAVIRGDVATESKRIHALVQAGVLLPDEARAELGYSPLPDGIGQIPQITPVGGAPNDPEPVS